MTEGGGGTRAAWISGVALILASVIGGVFVLLDEDSSSSPSQPHAGFTYPAANPVKVPPLDCNRMIVAVNEVVGTKSPLEVGFLLDVRGPDRWQDDPRQLWTFTSGGGAPGYYPSRQPALRRDGVWSSEVQLGRVGHPEDIDAPARYLHVALVPLSTGTDIERKITNGSFDWDAGLATLPPGTTEIATVPLQRKC